MVEIGDQPMGLDYFGCDLDKDYVEFMKSQSLGEKQNKRNNKRNRQEKRNTRR